MFGYLVKRLGYALISLAILVLTVLALTKLGGDPALMMVEPGASQADIDAVRQRFGLDQPFWVQYFQFIWSALRGNLGQSIYYQAPVIDLYLDRFPASLLLASVAFGWSVVIGIGAGIIAAVYPNRIWDRICRFFALIGMAMPSFWMGMLLIILFAVQLDWLPSSGEGSWKHLLMPAITLGGYPAASHMRITRSAMLEVLGSDYVRLARLKGLPEWMVILKHAFKGALIPVLTLASINIVTMINAAVVVETVFAWPGIGRLLFEAISFRDIPVVQVVVLLAGVMIVFVNLATDLLYAIIDPRIRTTS